MDILKKHIELIYSKSNQYKTIIYNQENPLYYNVVTKVTYLTNLLWIDYINNLIKLNPQLKIEKINKVNWLTLNKQYRRNLEKQLKNKL